MFFDIELTASLALSTGRCMFPQVKVSLLVRVLRETSIPLEGNEVGNKYKVRFNRHRASQALSTDKRKDTMFAQAHTRLGRAARRGRLMRTEHDAWGALFVGERADDAGGPYRESMASMCAELQGGSPALKLLVPTPNAVNGEGEFQEAWMVNPEASSDEGTSYSSCL